MPALSAFADILDKAADQLLDPAITSEELSVRGLPGQSGDENKLLTRTRDQVVKEFGASDDLRVDVEIFLANISRPPPPHPDSRRQFASQLRWQAERLREFAAERQKKAKELRRVHKLKLQKPPAEAIAHVTDEDWDILQALNENHPKLLTQEQIEGAIPDMRVAVRTIQRRLPILRDDKKLVVQPEGKRSGWGLSPQGLAVANRKK